MKKCAWMFLVIALFVVAACKKKTTITIVPPATVPQLTTTAVSNITTNSAMSGGTITSDGGAQITASGICYSKTIQFPSIADDTTKGTVASGSFNAGLRNLQSGVTYYVRAYAINSEGIGYGNVVYFKSTNAGPEARGIIVEGRGRVGETLKARFTYFDAEQDPKDTIAFQWYVADNFTSAGTAIANATDSTLFISADYQGKFLRVVITPKALTGTTTGVAGNSARVGPVEQPETVTFTYNGQSVTYTVITSPVTGRRWLDRNLGARNMATAYDDWLNMGDLFQWGRGADGHQLIIRRPPNMLNTGVNDTTHTLSAVDNPGHSLFITVTGVPANWRRPNNPDLWQMSTGINNVCPAGWHVPTRTEWEEEQVGNREQAYTQLKITAAGLRGYANGRVGNVASSGIYWSSTASPGDSLMTTYSLWVRETNNSLIVETNLPATGCSVRCIKN
jgi:uncharacterized protein (TIGR02145 family)